MKKFKTADFFLNSSLIAGFAIYYLFNQDTDFLTGYFVVGGWQVISMLVHAYHHCFTYKKGSRYYYHRLTLVSILTMPVGSLWLLLFVAPVMAVYYTCICYREVYIKMQRPLAVLK